MFNENEVDGNALAHPCSTISPLQGSISLGALEPPSPRAKQFMPVLEYFQVSF